MPTKTRISQIIANLHSPKRASSLVLQTGFPTSLIDLFVKNRTRFRKPKPEKPLPLHVSDTPPETPCSSGSPVVCAEPRRTESPKLATGNVCREDGVTGSGSESDRIGELSDRSSSKSVIAASLKMFTVVVLIAIANNLTVGITVSAFALTFLENAGKRIVSCPYTNVGMIKSLTRRVSCFVWFQKGLNIKKDCERVVLFKEIEVVENRSVVDVCSSQGTCFVGNDPELDCFKGDDKRGPFGACEISLSNSSRSVKLKSKMKKLVPKKLRGHRKEGKEMLRCSKYCFSVVKEDKSWDCEREVDQKVENGNISILLPQIELESVREKGVDDAVTFSQECLVESEEKRMGRVGDSGYTITFVIALVGLVIGRFPALVLTITWCFVLKIVTTRWRSNGLWTWMKCGPKSS
ncbi:hypothetical protein RJT34_04039 [Clitoria ternatea]|uniref:Uncharacterized protein n=1 Tax=Clitoria ternatea TaxID=43366 RepID=A0AAN9KKJ2_CLITE